MKLTEKEIQALKEKIYGRSSRRNNIPLQFYTLPDDVLRTCELEKERKEQAAKEAKKQKAESIKRAKGLMLGEETFSMKPHSRRSVGNRTDDVDPFGDYRGEE